MPTAVTPPETPMGKATPNPNTEALAGKKRKIVCFSGKAQPLTGL